MSNKEVLKPNMDKIKNGIYLVRTQAGFRKAIKEYRGPDYSDKVPTEGYPKSYPSVVFLSYGYRGYIFIQANCIQVNKLNAVLKDC